MKCCIRDLSPLISICIFLGSKIAQAQDVVGCGGYIKSSSDIDLTKIQVGLYTERGTLKDSTDCAPTSGYFFIPVYSNGKYKLKVISAPDGWDFSPSEVVVDVDGESDICSRGQDINFEFVGYNVQGQILNRDDPDAISGAVKVKLELVDASGKVLDTAVSGGKYSFSGVKTGKYVVRISDESLQTYSFQESEHPVSVQGDSARIRDFIILGFDIDGEVLFEGVSGDRKALPNWPVSIHFGNAVKETKTDKRGRFSFPNMSQGSYVIRTSKALAQGDLSMGTAECDIQVKNGKSEQCKIVVDGCKMKGSVAQGGKGIPNVEVEIVQGGNKFTTMSDDQGAFKSQLLKAGKVDLAVVNHKDLKFKPTTFTVDSPMDTWPALRPERVRFEGLLEITKAEPKLSVKCKSKEDEVSSDVTGKTFSIFLGKGDYVCTVVTGGSDSAFFSSVTVKVDPDKRQEANKLTFSYSKVRVLGTISCFSTCSGITVDMFQQSTTKIASAKITGSKFEFSDVRPGEYKIIASGTNACWEKNVIDVKVTTNDVVGLKFIQKGKLVTVDADNPTILKLGDKTHQLEKGKHEICIDSLAELPVSTEGCFTFSPVKKFNPKVNDKLELRTVGQKISGDILASEVIGDLQIKINDEAVRPLSASKQHHFEYVAKLKQDLLIRPTSQDYFFDPPSIKLNVKADACSEAATFKAKKGVYVTGSVQPPIQGVRIDVQDRTQVETDASGAFRIGPVPSEDADKLKLSATKEGYYFTQKSGESAHFIAHKLATISVEVRTKAGEPLLALVSISGGSMYRNNSHTADGKVAFMSIHPGEYFVKPFMKEYQFEPRSTTLTVKEAKDDMKVSFIGERTAFTAHGKVTYLSGVTEEKIAILARGQKDPSNGFCEDHSEDSYSAPNGDFSLQGLKPGCTYKIEALQNLDDHVIGVPALTMGAEDASIGNIVITKKHNLFTLAILIKTTFDENVPVEINLPNSGTRDVIVPTNTLSYFDSLPQSEAEYRVRIGTVNHSFSNAHDNFKYLEVSIESRDLISKAQKKTQNRSRNLPYALPVIVIVIGIIARYTIFGNK